MIEINTRDQLMEQIVAGNIELVNFGSVCSDRLVHVHDRGTQQQRMETLERSDYRLAVPLVDEIALQPLEDSAA